MEMFILRQTNALIKNINHIYGPIFVKVEFYTIVYIIILNGKYNFFVHLILGLYDLGVSSRKIYIYHMMDDCYMWRLYAAPRILICNFLPYLNKTYFHLDLNMTLYHFWGLDL